MRNPKIDFLRFLGLSLIILAHVDPPNLIFQIRNFDVPMMVVVSGLAFASSAHRIPSYTQYVWKRIKRLLFPMWFFLTAYFCACQFFPSLGTFDLTEIVASYALVGVIGLPATWIIRVFLLVALFAPIILEIDRKIKDNRAYLYALALGFAIYEFILFFTLPLTADSIPLKLVGLVVYYGIAFSLVFALGLRLPKLSKSQCFSVGAVALGIFVSLAAIGYGQFGDFLNVQSFKYPPSAYYLSYAIAVVCFLWPFVGAICNYISKFERATRFILLVSQNSMWIYLWHIPLVTIFRYYDVSSVPLKYICVYAFGLSLAIAQSFLVKKVLVPSVESEPLRKNLTALLTG